MNRNRVRRYIVAMMLIMITPLSAFAAGQVGEAAADFTLLDTSNISHTLSDHVGEVVYLFMVGHN